MSNKEGELPPFFMEKIAREKRAQFRVIEGSGNNYNSIDSRMSFLMGRVYLEDAILDAIKCLKSKKLPVSGGDCDYCRYREAVKNLNVE